MQVKCDSCGKVVELPEYTETSIAAPKGWRRIWTMMDEYTSNDAESETSHGESLHSCDDCNAGMTVDEHLEAEFESRKIRMGGK